MKKFLKENATKKKPTIEDSFFICGMALSIALLCAAATVFLCPELLRRIQLPPCWFYFISGYYCPGCGGTRAVRALLHGHVLKALWYHPFVPYAAAVYLHFMVTQAIERASHGRFPIGMRYHDCLAWIAAALIIVNFIVKNALRYFYGFML